MRKILHVVSIYSCGKVIFLTQYGEAFLPYLFIIFTFILYLASKKKWIPLSQGESYGIAFFPLGFAILLFLQFDTRIIYLSSLVLAFADAGAALIGINFAKKYFKILYDSKSIIGSITFFIITALILSLQSLVTVPFSAIIIISTGATMSELFSYKGSDNLSILLVSALLIRAFIL